MFFIAKFRAASHRFCRPKLSTDATIIDAINCTLAGSSLPN